MSFAMFGLVSVISCCKSRRVTQFCSNLDLSRSFWSVQRPSENVFCTQLDIQPFIRVSCGQTFCLISTLLHLSLLSSLLSFNFHLYLPALWTKAFSILPTSALNCSTSSQQSNGLRSFFLKQFLTFSRAVSSSGEGFSSCLRDSSLAFKSMISVCTLSWLRPESGLGAAAAGLPALWSW